MKDVHYWINNPYVTFGKGKIRGRVIRESSKPETVVVRYFGKPHNLSGKNKYGSYEDHVHISELEEREPHEFEIGLYAKDRSSVMRQEN